MTISAFDAQKNASDTTDAGTNIMKRAVTSPAAGDVYYTRIDTGSSTTLTEMSSSNPLFAQLTAGTAEIGKLAAGTAEIGNVTNSGTFAVQVDGDALTALQLIDDTVVTLGTTTYTEASSKGNLIGAVRNDTLAALANTDNEIAPLQVNASGAVYVECSTVASHDVTNAGTFVVQIDGTALTRLTDIETNTDFGAVTGGGVEASALRVTIASDSTGLLPVSNAGLTELAAAINSNKLDIDIASSTVDVMLGTDFSTVFGTSSLVLGTQADDVANTSDGVQTTSFAYVFDGTTWDRLRGDATNGALVNLGSNNDVTLATLPDTAAGDLAAVRAAVEIMDDWDETNRAAVNIIASQVGITAGAGAVAANTPRVTLASDDPAVVALQIIDDWDETNRAAVNLISGQAGIAGGTGVDGATVPRVTLATDVALPAGTNAIGKLAANSGVDIGDVDVTSISAQTTGGCSFFKSIDLDESEEEVKATAGTFYGGVVINLTASVLYFKIYNATAASVVVGTTVPDLTIPIPTAGSTNGAGFNIPIPVCGVEFDTAITVAVTTGVADNDSGAPAANACAVALFYE